MSFSPPPDFNEKVIAEFRENGGRVSGMFEGMPLLLLHSIGAKSGTPRLHPLAHAPEGGNYLIFASKAGASTNPDWYHNLKAHPETSIEVGSDTLAVTATEVTGEERDRLYAEQAERAPQFAEYAKTANRAIPVVRLTPTG